MKDRAKRVGLLSVMTLSAINIWTGAPLLALWVGSRVVDSMQPTMGAMALIGVVLFATALAMIAVMGTASAAHDRLTGRPQTVKRHVPWLRSMRAERVVYEKEKAGLTPVERLLVAMVVLAVCLLEVWFFFFSPSPI